MVTINHSIDHLVDDNQQTVTLRTYRNATETDTQTDYAFSTSLTRRDTLLFGVNSFHSDERGWTVAALDLDTAGEVIRRGDKIAEDTIAGLDGNTVWWSVKQAVLRDDGTSWRCICTKDR